MSADLWTNIHFKGTKDEMKAVIDLLKKYESGVEKEWCHIDIGEVIISKEQSEKAFSGTKVSSMSEDELTLFLESANEDLYFEASGPWGDYGPVSDAGIFEDIATVTPNAFFEGSISGFTTGQQDLFTGTLENAKLSLHYEFLVNEAYSEYLYEENVGESFVEIFKITEEDFEDCFYDFAEDIICDEFYECNYVEFKKKFQTSLKEEEFHDAMERFRNLGLISEEDLWCTEENVYDPIKKEYM